MSRYHGPQYTGARRDTRRQRRLEAEERNARTPIERRRFYRQPMEVPF